MRSIIAASVFLVALAGAAQADECPAAFQGAKVTAAKLPEGVSLEFRASHRQLIPLLREQLREVADMLEQQSTQTQTTGADDEHVEFPPVDVAVKDVALGARVIVRAGRFSDVPALRELAFGFAEFWKTSACSAPLVSQH